jgi:AcrR family transcriptional regulator
MAEAMTRPRRLTAEARRRSLLQAARQAFTETGDVNGTTVRLIAERAGISEGVIYRHFESKDQLFIEAVVEPLREAVDELVAATELVDKGGPLTVEGRQKRLQVLYRQLVSTLVEVLPLLGLVLFGDPKVARRFYTDHLSVAMDRLAAAWSDAAARHGIENEGTDVSARAVVGIALLLAMETCHTKDFDEARAIELVSTGTMQGFFPHVEF